MRKLLSVLLVLLFLGACTPYNSDPLAPVEEYLVENIGEASFGGEVFCSYDVLEMGVRFNGADVYVWALCGEYYLEDGTLTMGTASSLPVALYMKISTGGYSISGYDIPRDGMEYGSSIRQIFPAGAIEAMCEGKPDCYNERAIRLENDIEAKAMEYYGMK
jgi:hypothetical protein